MTNMPKSLGSKKFLLFLAALLISTDLAILLDIPFLRQIIGFLFLTVLQGLLILQILKLNKIGFTEKFVLAVGLSISFLMLFGLLVNNLSLALGYETPLATIPLLISFNLALIVIAIIGYKINKEPIFSLPNIELTTSEKAFLIVPILFPALSIFGMHVMNTSDNNIILMFLLFLIPAYVIFISFYHHKVPQRLYPSLIFLIGVSLLLMLSLRSNHIIGSDIHEWYYTFQMTLDNLHWSVLDPSTIDACLSISLLPAIYYAFLNINPECLFMLLYPLLFSASPLVVYIIAKKYIDSFYAFLASFFFMAQLTFLWTTGTSNTNLAIFFFALVIMVLFHQDIGEFAKRFLFIIFAASCIISHYSTSYIFLFVLLFTGIGMEIMHRILARERKVITPSKNPIAGSNLHDSLPNVATLRSNVTASKSIAIEVPRSPFKRGITMTIVLLFFVMLFFWYSQITAAAFNAGVGFIHQTFINLNEWYVMELKGPTIAAAAGKDICTIPQRIRLVVSWLSIAFIAIGVLSTMARYKRMVAIPNSEHIKPNFLHSKFEIEYFVLALIGSAILCLSIILPFVMTGYSMERTFFQMLTVLSLFFVVGGIMVAKWLRVRPHWVILLVLIPFFMCTTGTMYQIFDVPASIALNSAGNEYELWYVHDQDSYAAKWVSAYGKGARIYTGAWPGPRVLHSQGKIPCWETMRSFISKYQEGKEIDGYIYLRYTDVVDGKLVAKYPDIFVEKNKICANGGSEIYK